MNKTLVREIILFGVGGVWGFGVDAGVLWLLLPFLGPYGGRAVAFLMAVLATWVFNRKITFRMRQSGRSLGAEFVTYLGSMLFGGALNLGVYSVLVFFDYGASGYPLLPLVFGSLAGMLVNFLMSRFFLFHKPLISPKAVKPTRIARSNRKTTSRRDGKMRKR